MGFAVKTDFCGLSEITELAGKLLVRDANENKSAEKYQPQGQDGSFVGTEVYGEDSAPTNSYGLKADITLAAGKIKLNKVKSIGEGQSAKKYALESIKIGTSAGAAPTIEATSQEIEASGDDASQCHYSVPALTLTKKHHAQILFGAFTLTGNGCTLTECSAVIGGSINKDKVAGVKVSSDINSGVITVTGTVLQAGTTEPTLAAADNFVITSPLNCTNPESAYKSYTFELQLILAKDAVTPPSNGGGSQST